MKVNLPIVLGAGLLLFAVLKKRAGSGNTAAEQAPPVELPFVPAEDISQLHSWNQAGIPQQTANALTLQSLQSNPGQWTGTPFTGQWGASSWASGGPLF